MHMAHWPSWGGPVCWIGWVFFFCGPCSSLVFSLVSLSLPLPPRHLYLLARWVSLAIGHFHWRCCFTGSQTVCMCLCMCLGGSSVCEACVLSSQIMQTLTVSCHSHTASESQGAWTSPTDWSWGPETEDLPQSVPGPLLHLAISSMIVSCFSSLLPLWVTFIVNWAFLSHKWHQ